MISKVPDFRLSLLGRNLFDPVQSAKDLGVTFDPSLSFDCRIVKTFSSCISSLAQINRVKHILDKSLLTLIIRTIVSVNCITVRLYGLTCTASNISKLQAVQNFAARIIMKSRKFDHITPLLNELHWIPVKLHLLHRDAVLAFKCLNGTTPESLSQQLVRRADISGRCTRNSNSLDIPFFKSATGVNGLSIITLFPYGTNFQRILIHEIFKIFTLGYFIAGTIFENARCVTRIKHNESIDVLWFKYWPDLY